MLTFWQDKIHVAVTMEVAATYVSLVLLTQGDSPVTVQMKWLWRKMGKTAHFHVWVIMF